MHFRSSLWRQVTLIAWLASLGGCGSDKYYKHPSSSAQPTNAIKTEDASEQKDNQAANEVHRDGDAVVPPKEYYDALFAMALQLADTPNAPKVSRSVLWVNFDGAEVTKGFGRTESFLLCKSRATIPAAVQLSDAERDEVVKKVQAFYDATGAVLGVTRIKPTNGDFTTIHVGGSYSDLGCVGGSGVLGIAPLDAGDANKNDIGYAFIDEFHDVRTVAETVAHESGHSFGLDHVVEKIDLMYPSSNASITGFGVSTITGSGRTQDEPQILKVALGTSGKVPPSSDQPVAQDPANTTPAPAPTPKGNIPVIPGLPNIPLNLATLPGLGELAGLAALLPSLGGSNLVDLSKILPELKGIIPGAGGTNLKGLDQVLTIFAIANSASSKAQLPTLISSLITAGPGGQVPDLSKLVQQGGFGNLNSAVQALSGIFGGKNPQVPSSLGVPDLASLLNLGGKSPDLPALLNNFSGSVQLINSNFGGNQAQALLSLLKVAYSQQYLLVIAALI